MKVETIGRDCLFLNWAVREELLPEVRPPLRYQVQDWEGARHVFVSAVLFRHQGRHRTRVPLPRVSYPQLSLRICTLDAEDLPSFYLHCVLIPAWALPSARLVGRQPARKGTFDYPEAGVAPGEEALHWRVRSRGHLEVRASESSPLPGQGPSLGSWEQTLSYFRRRRAWYLPTGDGLLRVEVGQSRAQAVPLKAEIGRDDLLPRCLSIGQAGGWPALHSAWYSPEVPYVYELGGAAEGPLPSRVPAPG